MFTLELPVNCRRASKMVTDAIARANPAAVLGLGQAGGRPTLSIEKVALNLADERASRETDGGANAKPIVAKEARARVDHADLRALLFAQGYSASTFVTD